jgi:hypothetical protein
MSPYRNYQEPGHPRRDKNGEKLQKTKQFIGIIWTREQVMISIESDSSTGERLD